MVGVLGLDVLGLNWGIIDVAQQKFYFVKATREFLGSTGLTTIGST